MSFFAELKRRNVFRVGIAYAVAAWIILQLTDVIGEIMELPDWGGKLILLLLIAGFPIALIFAWAFELTPEGVKRDRDVDRSQSVTHQTGRKLDFAIIGLLVIGLAYFIWESRFSSEGSTSPVTEPVAVETPAGAPTPAGADNKSIAVLPFTNRSPNQDDIYFTDGVHDDLLTQLAKLDAFSVISRTSVMEYRDTEKKIRDIANELGVANIMEGAVQRAGSQVRINVQLINAATDEHLWAEIYDRELTTENLFQIQSEIAQAIANALHATLTDEQIAAVAEAPTDNVAAYELYQEARRYSLGETVIGYAQSVELYEEALRLDPDFKLAWVGLAHAHINQYWAGGGDPANRQKSRDAIDRARAIDPNFPELFMAEGFYWYWGHLDYKQALENLERALELMPNNAQAHMWRGWASRRAGLWEQALASMNESVRLDPRRFFHWTELGLTYMYLGRYRESRKAISTAREINANDFWSKEALSASIINDDGDIETAERLMVGAQYSSDFNPFARHIEIHMLGGNFNKAMAAAETWPEQLEIQRSEINLKEQWIAEIQRFMGDAEASKATAEQGLSRLQELRNQFPGDYRLDLAEAQMLSLAGQPERIPELLEALRAKQPADAVEELRNDYFQARIFAMAGIEADAVKYLDSALALPSVVSVKHVELDRAFDDVRNLPEYQALMEKHRR